jgi:hypothetical protein
MGTNTTVDLLGLTSSDQLLFTLKLIFITKQSILMWRLTVLTTITFSATMESFLKGKEHYGRPPWTNKFRSASFHTETNFFYKTIYLNEEVNCTGHNHF